MINIPSLESLARYGEARPPLGSVMNSKSGAEESRTPVRIGY